MLRLEVLRQTRHNSANLAWVQAPVARPDRMLGRLNYYHTIPENILPVFGGAIPTDLNSTVLESEKVWISNKSVIHPDVRSPQPLWFIHRVGLDPLDGEARYEIQDDEAGAATLANARLILLRKLSITDQAGNVDHSLNWDLEIVSRSGDRHIVDLFVDRRSQQGISFFLRYHAWDTDTSQLLTNHREAINGSPIEAGQTLTKQNQGWTLTSVDATGLAPGLALFGTGTPPSVEIAATGISVGATTSIPRDLSIADVASRITAVAGVTATPLSPAAEEALQNGTFVPTANGTLVRQDFVHLQFQNDVVVEVEPFPALSSREPWYARIRNGAFTRVFGDYEYLYDIPEFDQQVFSTRFGAGTYREVAGEAPRWRGEFTLQTRRRPLWNTKAVKLYGSGNTDLTSLIKDVDLQNGLIYLNTPVSDRDSVELNYAVAEEAFEYRGINLNPTLAHNQDDLAEKLVGIYIVPHKIWDKTTGTLVAEQDQTIYHILADTVKDITDALEDPNLTFSVSGTDVLYRPLLLAILQPVQTASTNQVKLLDTRTPGGGLDEDLKKPQFTEREGEMYWDVGFWEGEPFRDSPVVVAEYPEALLGTGLFTVDESFPPPTGFVAPSGLLDREDVKARLDKYRAAGQLALMNPRQDLNIP